MSNTVQGHFPSPPPINDGHKTPRTSLHLRSKDMLTANTEELVCGAGADLTHRCHTGNRILLLMKSAEIASKSPEGAG